MAREWQQKKIKEIVLPECVYYETLWIIRDYERLCKKLRMLKRDRDRCINNNVSKQPSSRNYSNESYIENLATEIVQREIKIKGVIAAYREIPKPYRKVIYNNIKHGIAPVNIDDNWKMWKQKFIYTVAKNLYLV